jgi:hypothetical protein
MIEVESSVFRGEAFPADHETSDDDPYVQSSRP